MQEVSQTNLKFYLANDYPMYVIAITESQCSSSISNAETHLKSYNLYHFDSSRILGGGVLLYVCTLRTVICEKLMDSHIDDSLWCMITLPDNSKFLSVTYRPPSSCEDSKM